MYNVQSELMLHSE